MLTKPNVPSVFPLQLKWIRPADILVLDLLLAGPIPLCDFILCPFVNFFLTQETD